jgi:hypothetical protein
MSRNVIDKRLEFLELYADVIQMRQIKQGDSKNNFQQDKNKTMWDMLYYMERGDVH